MQLYNLSRHQIAHGTGRTLQTVDNWIEGRSPGPVYLDQALRAIAHSLPAVEPSVMDTLNLVRLLGVPPGTERYWRLVGYPQQARQAAAWASRGPTPHQRLVLRNIDIAGSYYRSRGAYRPRGRALPAAKLSTIGALRLDGYLTETNGRVRLTPAARTAIYKE